MPEFRQAAPKYVQMADHLRDRILRGDLRPGDEVPSERQLAADWGVSRPTATKALDLLRREGHLDGRRGAGTFVTFPPRIHRQASERYRRSIETGRIYPRGEKARILAAGCVPAPAEIALALGVPEGAEVVHRRRLIVRGEEPVELSTSWFDGELVHLAPRLVVAERILEGTLAYVEHMTGRRGRVARDRVSSRLATAEERALLALPDPSAVTATQHVVFDADEIPLEITHAIGLPGAWTVEHEYPVGR
ncbi:MAG TPA: GntR family transcriptional regulator [Acidimicrobiales bacterium]|nr:GntR family transcriptional regulator [Acidimicrobiales bacterium]